MTRALVSAVIPFLNGEQFLRAAIESIIAQTYPHWELLLVDDGSSDGSAAIALEYASAHSDKVRYLEHERHRNLGVSASRNLGIRHASGEYVAFLDADDVWLPRKLEQQVSLLGAHPTAGMLCGPSIIWRTWDGQSNGAVRDSVGHLGLEPNRVFEPPTLLCHFLHDDSATPAPGSLLVRRDAIDAVGGFCDEFRDMYEDQAFYAKVSIALPILVTEKCSFKYRKHDGSICSMAIREGRHLAARLAFLEWVEGYLSERAVTDDEVWRTLRRELSLMRDPSPPKLLRRGIRLARALQHPGTTARSMIPGRAKRIVRRALDTIELSRIPRVRARMGIGCEPLSQSWSFDRGLPIHRYYVERFLRECASDIHGRCLEFQEDSYTTRFGGTAVRKLDVLHLDASNPNATIAADLTRPNDVPSNAFDCIICTHVLHVVDDVTAFVRELHRILAPEGVLLMATPFVSMCGPQSHELSRLTPEGLRRLLASVFADARVSIRPYGNSLTAAGELRGLVVAEFSAAELDLEDARFAVEICARAAK
jgi:glycosyltransferase involved in cell wall biosynthesis